MASDSTLTKRKEQDNTRRRSNFQRHLQLIGPQKKYFEFMKTLANDRVQFQSAEKAKEDIKMQVEGLFKLKTPEHSCDLLLFDNMISWLRGNLPN